MNELIRYESKYNSELIENIMRDLRDMEVKENVGVFAEERKKQIILNHLQAYSLNGDRKEIEKAKIIITEISKY